MHVPSITRHPPTLKNEFPTLKKGGGLPPDKPRRQKQPRKPLNAKNNVSITRHREHSMSTKKRKWPQHTIRPHPETFKNGFPTPKIGGGV